MDPDHAESATWTAEASGPASWPRRLAALLALIALLASAAVTSWWILTGRADFLAAGGRGQPAAAGSDRVER